MKGRHAVKHFDTPILLVSAALIAACTMPSVHRVVSADSRSSSTEIQPNDRRILAGEWEYVDGAVVPLTLDEQGDGSYDWKDGRFRAHTLIGHVWRGIWFQKGNDRDGGFTVEFSQDFSEGEGRWWYSRIGADHTPSHKGGTFHLTRKATVKHRNPTPTDTENRFSR